MSKKIITIVVSGLFVSALTVFSIGNAFALNGGNSHNKKLSSQVKLSSPVRLSSPLQTCQEASRNYSNQIRGLQAKALSLQLTKEEVKALHQNLLDYRKTVCKQAKALPAWPHK